MAFGWHMDGERGKAKQGFRSASRRYYDLFDPVKSPSSFEIKLRNRKKNEAWDRLQVARAQYPSIVEPAFWTRKDLSWRDFLGLRKRDVAPQ